MQRSSSSTLLSLSTFALLAALIIPFASAAPTCKITPPKTASAPVTVPTAPTPTPANGTVEVVASGWYAGWLGAQLPPSQVSWSKYSSLTFAFAVTTPDSSVLSLDAQSTAVLPTFVSEAHKNGVDAFLSVGGWTGSIYFSSAMATAANRTAFLGAVLGMVSKYDLDGIDFDWEYPGRHDPGTCNTFSDSDSANFLLFLQQMRKDPVGSKLTITAAVAGTPFAGPGQTPLADVSGFATVLDRIAIMNYDIWGSWSPTVGPNAPLDDSCATVKAGSATTALKAWTAAGFPADKIVLGVAAYGHSFFVSTADATDKSTGKLALFPPFDAAKQPLGNSDVPGAAPGKDQCGNEVGPGGTFDFEAMITDGFLNSTGQAAPGMQYVFDTCSQTPFVYNPTSNVMISYDDATSFAAKGNFIVDNDLAGFAMWHIAGDKNDILVDAISDAIGLEQVCN